MVAREDCCCVYNCSENANTLMDFKFATVLYLYSIIVFQKKKGGVLTFFPKSVTLFGLGRNYSNS